jgi:mannosylglycerate hydrolase MGH1-like protein/glycosyl hydrolase family 65
MRISRPFRFAPWSLTLALALTFTQSGATTERPRSATLLTPDSFRHYFTDFARDEQEVLGSAPPVPWGWFVRNIPWLDTPDQELNQIYYFRWYAFQKHIESTPDGYVITEFLDPVPWAGKFNTIDAAAGHHIREARWLRDPQYVDDYTRFWFVRDGEPRLYSFWAADSVYQLYLASGDRRLATNLLPALEKNWSEWEATHQDGNGLFWQADDRDGMEDSISGNGYRPTINSYMAGDALAISRIADLAGMSEAATTYRDKAARLDSLIDGRLWNPADQFYETVPRFSPFGFSGVRELIGYVPWYFDIPPAAHDAAWTFLFAPQGFAGAYGPTTAERSSPRFGYKVRHECLWNGPSWPYATTQTLVALANMLNRPGQTGMTGVDYLRLLAAYVHSQHIRLPDGRTIPWIDEDLDADTGEWIARDTLASQRALPKNRGRYYNHSGFADLIITGLIGLRPQSGEYFVVHPLLPPGTWDYFALDGVPYHSHLLTIFYDRDGTRYHRGAGFHVLCDGSTVAEANDLENLEGSLIGCGKAPQ